MHFCYFIKSLFKYLLYHKNVLVKQIKDKNSLYNFFHDDLLTIIGARIKIQNNKSWFNPLEV